ncbi:hypothetical protein BC937DRAFT_91012 [Endogone sp. FLAS-F59071]|nr:hypothetical protein BC937DRAFT_91012 [Endogone sp. FLAS-F59071]|eukprot:RUS21929.1 hypothetical protein BC937DRAFT_91012 [Endogone sp. FLAS-F59071]
MPSLTTSPRSKCSSSFPYDRNGEASVYQTPRERTKRWKIWLEGTPGTLYEGERFLLEIQHDCSEWFHLATISLPTVPIPTRIPARVARGRLCIPIRAGPSTIYSNGHICLNILYKDWLPIQTVAQVCLSLQSMLSSCRRRPPDNEIYVRHASSSPKKTGWAFHDDSV